MRKASWLAFVGVLGLMATGCGGGGTAPSAAVPLVQGRVLSVDGAPLALGGVAVECVNDGTTVSTASDGSFTLEVPAGVVVRVRFHDRGAAGVLPGLPGCVEGLDDTHDRGDLDDDVVEVEPLDDGDVCVIEVELADGRVIECDVDQPDLDGPRFHREGVLVPVRPFDGHPPLGEVEVSVEGDCAALEVEAARLLPDTTYEVVLVSPDLAQFSLGTLTTDEHGAAHLRVAACAGDPLPFGVASVADLAGFGVFVNDESGTPILAGQIPGHGHEYGEPGHDGQPDGGHDGHPGDGHHEPPHPDHADHPDDGEPLPHPDHPDDHDHHDLIDLLEDLLGDNPFAGGLPGTTH